MSTATNRIVVFVGPSLPAAEVEDLLPDALIRPPAALGDVYRALQDRPRAIALIDGYFERVPAPWHKELLWVIDQGVPLLGAASMGALRAVELAPFGMMGLGRVVEWFGNGYLEDDDEVAVAHLSAEEGFRPTTEAMVNVRGTLDLATSDGPLTTDSAAQVCEVAKSLHYTERTWPAICHRSLQAGALDRAEAEGLRVWVSEHRVDVKADDARSLLVGLATETPGPQEPIRSWQFQHTTFWELALNEISSDRSGQEQRTVATDTERVLDELRLDPVEHREVHEEAFLRWLAAAYAQARSVELRPEETQATLDALRFEMGLVEPDDVQTWLTEQHMTVSNLRTVVREEAFLAWARARARLEMTPIIIDVLRRRRRYGELLDRASTKHRRLHDLGLGSQGANPTHADDEALVRWWFERQGRAVPDDLDTFLDAHRLGERGEWLRALRSEHGSVQEAG